MIEKVARAIIETMHGEPVSDEVWKARLADNADDRDTVMSWARAAILAMREPSKGMLEDGGWALLNQIEGSEMMEAQVCWRAMIDAALKEY